MSTLGIQYITQILILLLQSPVFLIYEVLGTEVLREPGQLELALSQRSSGPSAGLFCSKSVQR